MKSFIKTLLAAVFLTLLSQTALGQEQFVRVASYNIRFLSTSVTSQGDRLNKLREVVSRLDADVIGLQEIDNRAALALIFPPAEWQIVIDDNSNNNQDVALAVRRPFRVVGLPNDLNADA